ncbi:MAG: hypothetical protein ACOYVJ_04005 [Nitrospirota bacterium]
MADIEKDIKEIKLQLERICQILGIGIVPPVQIAEIKERAKKKALEIQKKRPVKS